MHRNVAVFSYLLICGSILVGGCLLGVAVLPFSVIRSLGDHLARDGQLTSLTPGSLALLRPWALALGTASLILAGWLIGWRKSSLRMIERTAEFLERIIHKVRQDQADLWKDAARLAPDWLDATVLLAILAGGFFARLVLLRAPMQYDESVTVTDFASRSLWALLSDYSLPNNHIFHTLLVHFSIRLFGISPWAVRLPAFIAGILSIVAAYFVGRGLYNRHVGLVAAALVAWWPIQISYSANARGYSLLGLITLMLIGLVAYVLKRRNTAAWIWIGVLSAVGLFTVPVMAYPIGILFVWLVLSYGLKPAKNEYCLPQFGKYLAVCGGLAAGLTLILYLPAMMVSGYRSIFFNSFVRSHEWMDFLALLPVGWLDIWSTFTRGMPDFAIALIVMGLGLSLVFHRVTSATPVHIAAAALIYLGAVLPIQRPNIISKVFLFSLPFVSMWVAAGWIGLISILARKRTIGVTVSSMLVVAVLIFGAFHEAQPNVPYLRDGVTGQEEQVIIWLKDQIRPGDIVLADFPEDGQLRFYAMVHGLSMRQFRKYEQMEYRRAILLVDPARGQSIQSLIDHHANLLIPVDGSSLREIGIVFEFHIYAGNPENLATDLPNGLDAGE